MCIFLHLCLTTTLKQSLRANKRERTDGNWKCFQVRKYQESKIQTNLKMMT